MQKKHNLRFIHILAVIVKRQRNGKKWDVFISYASEDKNTIERELAKLLDSMGVKIWYDEFSLKVGDSITQKIDEIKSFSLYLADKFALDTSKVSLKKIATKLIEVIRPAIFEHLSRLLLYRKLIKNGKSNLAKVSDLKWGEKQRNTLSKGYINRINSFYYIIGQNFNTSLDDTLNCYLYDLHPEREIQT